MTTAWIVLILSAFAVVYILIGYPVLLAMIKTRRAAPVAKDLRHEVPVTLIMSVFNGADYLRAKMETIFDLDYPPQLLQILVASDGSTDSSEAILAEYASRGVRVLALPHAGKATALNRAFEHATGEILFFTDVRQPLHRMALRHLVANFADPTVGAVTGEMKLYKGEAGEQADMDLYWRYELWARARHTEIDSLFNTTGCIYAMRRALAKPLPADTLSDDAFLPLCAFFAGYRVIYDPAAIAIDYPAVAGTEARRRFRNLAGLWQTFVRFPELFTSRNRMRFHFLSHKFARLMLPWMLVVFAAASLALPSSPWRDALLFAEAAFVISAWIDRFMPKGIAIKRLTSPARTFLAMNFASLRAPMVFLVKPERLWVPTRVK